MQTGDAASDLVIVCEHASAEIPPDLNDLGLDAEHRFSHAVWDPGALGVAQAMRAALDATLVAATVSRLVHDCNRPGGAPEAMPAQTEVIAIPGNAGLSAADQAERARRYYDPFRGALDQALADRPRPPVLVTVHSFSPVWHGHPRAVELGILHDTDDRLARAMLAEASAQTDLRVAANEPYGPEHGVTHTLRLHGVEKGHANVMLEIRNDLIADPTTQTAMGQRLAALVRDALTAMGHGGRS
ncbi:Riorf59 protein [Rhodovulum sp. P5]|uniref:N-formylglutamate amidohydrolase n=1 Tax=Rhodovulum sp. P5 TaxID=1564506 RepID=UPI0009C290A5|nr:N-formylglutamate amidohydrolase [Rhodovulum sp. P5]ARE39830.1 Riorf59 protein [Rhodovulum sp. P5]